MTGSIYFNNAELFGYSHVFNTWGESHHFSATETYNIRNFITGTSYKDDISGVFTATDQVANYIKSGICGIYVNNVYLGLGRVTNLNFEESTDVRMRKFSASVEIPLLAGSGGSGYINNTGAFFSSQGENLINYFTSPTGRYIKNFSFSQSSQQVASGKYSFGKSANFSIDQGIYDEYSVQPYDYARRLFGAIQRSYGNEYVLAPEYPNFYTTASGFTNTTQSFDILNNTYSYDESFVFQEGANYSWKYDHAIQYDGSIITVDENGSIKSTSISGDVFNPASTAWIGTVKNGIFSRCSGAYTGYTGFLFYTGGCGLQNYPIRNSIVKNACAGTIDYAYSYSTSPFNNSGYSHSYSNSINYGEDGYIVISENGNFRALTNVNSTGLPTVINAYNSSKSSITGRISGLYTTSTTGGYNSYCDYLSGGLKSMGKTESYNEYAPEVSYAWTFTDNPSYHEDGVSFMTKGEYSDSKSLHSFNYFPILNDSIIAQSATQATRGQFSNSVSVFGKTGISIDSLVSKALTKIQKPSGTDIYSSNYGYSFNNLTKNLSLSLDYVYTHYRNKEEFLVY